MGIALQRLAAEDPSFKVSIRPRIWSDCHERYG